MLIMNIEVIPNPCRSLGSNVLKIYQETSSRGNKELGYKCK